MIGSTDGLIAFASERGITISETQAPIYLRVANDYLDGLKWKGTPSEANQDDIFPREINGATVTEPKGVTKAAYRLAMCVADDIDLEPVVAGPQIIQESISGATSTTYSEAWIGAAPNFPWLDSLVGEWVDGSIGASVNFRIYRG
ncbi:head-tail adaptor Ad1 [Pectobacterium phage Ymer]|uniref:Head-tail adaptor Ad1 n=2 Tax=unclassified Caudoviricetes TaxID=2788787 RepID=A0AB39ABZ2_9CAUD|nr:hypothetical protein Abuela_12 [Pectobacterium phage Abuela]WCD42773.1 head tail adaptor protein [Pectobacterium phage Ymer]